MCDDTVKERVARSLNTWHRVHDHFLITLVFSIGPKGHPILDNILISKLSSTSDKVRSLDRSRAASWRERSLRVIRETLICVGCGAFSGLNGRGHLQYDRNDDSTVLPAPVRSPITTEELRLSMEQFKVHRVLAGLESIKGGCWR